MKKKVLYVITKSNWGGAQRYVYDLATSLQKGRFEIAVATNGNGPLIEKLEKAGIRILQVPHLQRNFSILKEVLTLWGLLKILTKEQPDIIHLNSSKAGGLGAIAAFIYKTLHPTPDLRIPSLRSRETLDPKIIFTVHGWGFLEARPAWQKSVIIFLSRLTALFQNYLIHVSKNDLTYTTNLNIAPPWKCVYIPLAIQQPKFLSRDTARKFFEKKCNIGLDKLLIGTVAELTKNKGLIYLFDAIKQLKLQTTNYKLQTVIMGDGEDKEKLQNQIQTLGLKNFVCLAGFIPNAARYLKAFDIFVLPSLKEGLPYTITEALTAGVPVITSGVGGIPYLIEHGKHGLIVQPANSPDLAAALKMLIADSEKRRVLGENGAKKIREQNTFPEMIRKHINLYLD